MFYILYKRWDVFLESDKRAVERVVSAKTQSAHHALWMALECSAGKAYNGTF